MMEEAEERGWRSGGDKVVCIDHVEVDELRALILDEATSTTCSYCDRVGDQPIAADVDVLIQRIAEALPAEWRNADEEGVPVDGGEYVFDTFDTWDLITDAVEEPPLNHEQLIIDVVAALPEHSWVQRDLYRLREGERLVLGWDDFRRIVKHHRRYFFAGYRERGDVDDPDFVSPDTMLAAIGDAARSAQVVREIPAGALVHRVRPRYADEVFSHASDLGPPPAGVVDKSGRMNPAGIPILYGAFDATTALAEAQHVYPDAEEFTIGTFRVLQPLIYVALADPPPVPSLFDTEERRETRQPIVFLRHFADAISDPFTPDDYLHIEYVPTQIVTEWFRTQFNPGGGQAVAGLTYGSARNDGGTNLALFVSTDEVRDPGTANDAAVLELVEHEAVSRD